MTHGNTVGKCNRRNSISETTRAENLSHEETTRRSEYRQFFFSFCIIVVLFLLFDDMLVRSLDEDKHLDDLWETFDTLRRHQMKLNPSKCAFRVSSGKFLGFMVSQRGIEAKPDKIQAILDMEPPKNIKEV